MMKKPTKEEIDRRILQSGVDAKTSDIYVDATTPMVFYCSKGHEWSAKLGNVIHNHQGCPYCSGRLPILGINDLWKVRPDVASLLLNPEDGYMLTAGSGRHVDCKCPNCGTISNHILANICKRGFSCSVCSDGISYPNKFMASMLEQLCIDYKPEHIIDGENYKYDFYLSQYNLIIEMHGRQHYEGWNDPRRQTLEKIQQNDNDKKAFVINNNIKNYIVIDSRCSDIAYIANKIKQSYLSTIFDLSKVDWVKCGFYTAGSLVYRAAELYNGGNDTKSIADELKVDKSSIHRWLKKATELGLCNWIKSTGFLKERHSIVLLNTKEQFDSVSSGGRKYDVLVQNISKVCRKQRAYAGLHPETGEPLVWRYVEDYDENEVIDFMSLLNPHVNYTTK